jgi:hypothetical protein
MDNKDRFVLLVRTYVQGLHLDEVRFEVGLPVEERGSHKREFDGGGVFNIVRRAMELDVDFDDERQLGQRALEFAEYERAPEAEKESKRPSWLPPRV